MEFKLPSMGEGVMEATIIEWKKNEGDKIEVDDILVEVATDKVDSEVPVDLSGKVVKLLKSANEVAQIGEAIAMIEIENGESEFSSETSLNKEIPTKVDEKIDEKEVEELLQPIQNFSNEKMVTPSGNLSPLVRTIIEKEKITAEELAKISPTGKGGRITKDDILNYLSKRGSFKPEEPKIQIKSFSSGDEIVEMDRMRSLIAQHMVESKRIAPHVTSFIETDVTNLVNWREKNKKIFQQRYGQNLTFTPLFIYAIAKAIQEFPMINISVDGNKIIKKKNINIGFATALPTGNLIVPVIKNADQLSIFGLALAVNDLSQRARENKLKPHEITEGTYTLTNLGTFGNIMGTPIINQPQVAIMAVGAIQKKPAVIETPQGDFIGIRHKMFISHAYDHRVVDGALGGMFLKKVSDILENFDFHE